MCATQFTYFPCTKLILGSPQSANENEDYAGLVNVDALLIVAGDPAGEDEPMRKGTSLQVGTLHESHCTRSTKTYGSNGSLDTSFRQL